MSRSLVSPLFKSTLVFYFVRSPAFAPVFLSAFIIPAAPPASYGLLFCSFFRSAPQCFLHLGPLILSSSSKHNTHISAFILREKKKDKLLKKKKKEAIFQNKSHLHLPVLLLIGMRQGNANVLNFKKSLYAISSHHQHLYSVSKPMTVCLQQRQGRYFG